VRRGAAFTVDPKPAGVSESDWAEATAGCCELRVSRIVEETHDACSIVFEIPEGLQQRFAYKPGQFLSFKVPYEGDILVRSYSLASSPHTDAEHKVTVKRVEAGRISNWLNDHLNVGDTLMVVPPAGLFVLGEADRGMLLFAGGSGITPVISIIKSALATTERQVDLVYANRDERSIIFEEELDALERRYEGRLRITHLIDTVDGFLTPQRVRDHVADDLARDFYMCGPGPFMDIVEQTLHELGVQSRGQIHIERFVSPHAPGEIVDPVEVATDAIADGVPEAITIVLDGRTHELAYREGESVLAAVKRAGLDPPFSCQEGYCSCCMAKLVEGDVKMKVNDCLTPDLLAEGWVLTCQSRCQSRKIRIEYPD
jgi:3-ketosteroid 9alpha-monooxygenase subunit B